MKTPMQNLAIFIKKQAYEAQSLDVRRALLGTITVINATCIEPEKQMVIDAYNIGEVTGFFDKKQEALGEQYYNNKYKNNENKI